jgi:putative transposase
MSTANYCKSEDPEIIPLIQDVIQVRPTYGYKRVTALVNRNLENSRKYSKKRIYRIMKNEGLLLPLQPVEKRVHTGTGKVIQLHSNTRWSSDCFEIHCWNDDRVYVAFSIDCCDREIISYIAQSTDITQTEIQNLMIQSVDARFKALKAPRQIEWLSDRGSVYRAFETQRVARYMNLKPCYTAAYSPSSNGISEAFVNTIKRDYVYVNDCYSAETVLRELPKWIEDYNQNAPHSGLKMMSPREYMKTVNL